MVARHVSTADLRRIDRRNGTFEATYFVDLSGTDGVSALMEDLERAFPGMNVTFIDQSQLPSV